MLDTEKLNRMYDEAIEQSGEPPLFFALYDRRVLLQRSLVAEQVERETEQRLSLQTLDDMAGAGLFTWLGGAGKDGTDLGIPLYVPSRIGLFAKLEAKGWTREELCDFTEWEEWVVDDCIAGDDLSYEDSDLVTVARQVRRDLGKLNNEIWGRLPADQQPAGWHRTSWDSVLAKLTTRDLEAKRDRVKAYLRRVEETALAKADQRWTHHLRRSAFRIRFWEETIRVMLFADDRAKLEAGFSPAIEFRGEHALAPDPERLEEFGRVDWEWTLRAWRFLDDPDHFPLRLPGFVLVGGRITLDGLLSPEDYARRCELFNLGEYIRLYTAATGERRCAHCAKLLKPSASDRRRYCSAECSQAFRQKAYRQRQKEAILRHRASPE